MNRLGPLGRAWSQMRRDPWLQGVAVMSLAVALAIVGAYLNLCLNLETALSRLATGVALKAVMREEVPAPAARELARELAARPEVAEAAYLDQEEALARFRRQLGSHAGLLEGLEENPLPAAVEIVLKPDAPLPNLEAHLKASGLVEELVSSRPWLSRLEKVRDTLAELAAALGLLLFAAVVLLVANTVRLLAYVRRDELTVMELVGANRSYLRRPFLLETLLQGVTAAGLASLLVFAIFRLLADPAGLPLGMDLGSLLAFRFPQVPLILLAVAVAAGLVGGWLGVGRALRFRGL